VRPRVAAALAVAALAIGGIVLFALRRGPEQERPAGSGSPAGPALVVHCTSCGTPATRVSATVPAQATLTFAYQNPQGAKRLMVLAVDDRKQIYWFHPDPVRDPESVKIDTTETARELPGEITRTFAGDHVIVLGLFSDQALFAGKVESLAESTGCASLRELGVTCVERRLAVRRAPR
jgi:hypothetical protein